MQVQLANYATQGAVWVWSVDRQTAERGHVFVGCRPAAANRRPGPGGAAGPLLFFQKKKKEKKKKKKNRPGLRVRRHVRSRGECCSYCSHYVKIMAKACSFRIIGQNDPLFTSVFLLKKSVKSPGFQPSEQVELTSAIKRQENGSQPDQMQKPSPFTRASFSRFLSSLYKVINSQ
jgi:hypothetical protein